MEEIIRQLEIKREDLEVRLRKVNQAIDSLKDLDTQPGEKATKPKGPSTARATPVEKRHKKRGRPRLKPEIWPKKEKEKPDRKRGKYTPEVKEFIEENLDLKNRDLAKEINKRFNLGTTANGIAFYKSSNGLTKKRIAPVGMTNGEKSDRIHYNRAGKYMCNQTGKNSEKMTSVKKKVTCENCLRKMGNGRRRKAEESEEELEFPTEEDIEATSGKKKEESKSEFPEIEEFVMGSKITDSYAMRDKIIEKFEKDIPMAKIKKMISKRLDKEDLEEVQEEDNDLDMGEFG